MAKRTDFKQKLLDDLKLRKEQMAMSQASSNLNQRFKANATGNFRRPSQGTRAVNQHKTVGPTTRDRHKRFGTAHNRPPTIDEASKETVPIGRARSSEQIEELSMALSFALDNGEKLKIMASSCNAVVNFLHQIGRPVDSGEMRGCITDRSRPSNSSFHTLSHLHIKEISKGAQNLNQILKACSNGLDFNRYSIEIGKELLKKVTELEESLRMLVNLQEEDSENIINPQRKQRIRLIEAEDDDETTLEGNEHGQMDRSKFSSAGPSRNYHEDVQEVKKTSFLKQGLLTVSYLFKAPHLSSKVKAPTTSSNSVSHRRSVICNPDSSILATSSDPMKHSSSSHSKTEKGRIPSVIARLMGLQELPNMDTKNGTHEVPGPKQGTVGMASKHIAEDNTKKVEQRTMHSKNPAPRRNQTTRQQVLQANTSATLDTSLVLEADKILVPHNATHKRVVREEVPHLNSKNKKNMNLMSDTKKATFKINNPQINMNQMNQIIGIQKDKQENERKQKKPNPKELKRIVKGESKELVPTTDLQRMVSQTCKHPEAANFKQEKAGTGENTHPKEKKNTNRFSMPINQREATHDSGSQQPQPSEFQGAKLLEVQSGQQNTKKKLQVKRPKGSEVSLKPIHHSENLQKKLPQMNHVTAHGTSPTEAFDTMPSEASPVSSHHEDLIRDINPANHKLNMNRSPNKSSEKVESDVEKVTAPVPPVLILEPVCTQPRQKVDNRHVCKSESPPKIDGKINEVVTRNIGVPQKQQVSFLQESKQRREHKTKKEVIISGSNKAEANNQPLNFAPNLQKESDPPSALRNPVVDRYQRPREPNTTVPYATREDVTSEALDSLQAPILMLNKDEALKSSHYGSIQLIGPHDGGVVSIFNSSQQKYQKTFATQGSLSENEDHLKQILVKSQIFLNAAEALFKIQIPVDILHASDHKCQDEENKLVLDCGYEVMRRKGRRQELTFHPCVKISLGFMMVKDLDDLVKELHEDLEELKFCSKNGSNEYDTAKYLHKMLEREIQNRNPDMNCMWDFSWSEMMFTYLEKDEVIRDVEKHVLNGLVDEITRDMLHVNITI